MFSMINPNWTQFIIDKPPTLYSILESIVNYGTDNKTKIKDLASNGRTKIFDFIYPLSSKINKEDFEKMILNNFIERRIGFETMTMFKIKLNVKLNEIMPVYNKMFDMLDGWDIFNDGEEYTRILTDVININSTDKQDINGITSNVQDIDRKITNVEDIEGKITNNNEISNSTETNSQTSSNNTTDIRKSDTPQSRLDDVQNASYVTDYEYNTGNSDANDNATSKGTSTASATNTEDKTINTTNTEDKTINTKNTENKIIKNDTQTINEGKLQETVTRTQNDKLKLYTEFIEKRNHIYSMIFKELDCLFYQLV